MDLIRSGRSFLLSDLPLYKPHLWFVLTDSEGNPGRVVTVMVQSVKRHTDPTVVLRPRDHPFIRHESSVSFSTADLRKVVAIRGAIQRGRCHLKEDMSTELLARVRQGLLDSPFTIHAIQDYCKRKF